MVEECIFRYNPTVQNIGELTAVLTKANNTGIWSMAKSDTDGSQTEAKRSKRVD